MFQSAWFNEIFVLYIYLIFVYLLIRVNLGVKMLTNEGEYIYENSSTKRNICIIFIERKLRSFCLPFYKRLNVYEPSFTLFTTVNAKFVKY